MSMFRFRDRASVLDDRSRHFLTTVAWLGGYVSAEQAQEPGHARAHAADMRTDAVAQNDDPQEEARSHECGPGAPPAAGEKHAPGIVHARTVRQPSAGSEVS